MVISTYVKLSPVSEFCEISVCCVKAAGTNFPPGKKKNREKIRADLKLTTSFSDFPSISTLSKVRESLQSEKQVCLKRPGILWILATEVQRWSLQSKRILCFSLLEGTLHLCRLLRILVMDSGLLQWMEWSFSFPHSLLQESGCSKENYGSIYKFLQAPWA